jgi:AcrR family transcriptional regulator
MAVRMGVAERKRREREQRTSDILSAAEKLFLAKGYDGTTMDDIARAAELGKGTLYLYFRNKEEAYSAIVLKGVRLMNGMFREAVAGKKKGIDKASAMGAAFYEFYEKHPDYCRSFLFSTFALKERENRYAGELAELGASSLGLMTSALREGMKDGSIRPDIDVAKTAVALAFGVQGVVMELAAMDPKMAAVLGGKPRDFVEYSIDLLRRGMENRRR